MIWPEALLAFFLAFFTIVLLSLAFGMGWWSGPHQGAGTRARPWGGAWFGFLMMFVLIWAVGVWVDPVGPVFYGVAWLPFLIVAVLVALLMASVAVPDTRARGSWGARTEGELKEPPTEPSPQVQDARVGATIIFWLFIIGLIAVIVLAYI